MERPQKAEIWNLRSLGHNVTLAGRASEAIASSKVVAASKAITASKVIAAAVKVTETVKFMAAEVARVEKSG